MLDNIKSCTGCAACANICPKGAIEMKENNEGFLYPEINKELCVNCNKCTAICPEINKINLNTKISKTYYAIAKETKDCASGGIFSLLGKKILQDGGYVAGCTFQDDWSSEHIIISDVNELYKLKGSKYIQSKIGSCYQKVKKLLNENKKVLFSGTPCQISGLYAYLEKDYDNLITVDILCHGVPSYKVFQKYLKETYKDKIRNIDFKYKNGKNQIQPLIKITTDSANHIKTYSHDDFMRLFLKDVINRASCSNCKYAKDERIADITLGDFWNIEEYDNNLNPRNGISLITFNNKKGEEFFEYIKQNVKSFSKVSKEIALKGNPILSRPFKAHKNRKLFFKNLDKLTLKDNINYCLDEKFDIAIINLWYTCNFGAILTAYALQEFTKSLGYKTKIINNVNTYYVQCYEHYKNVISRYLDLTDLCQTEQDFKELNNHFDTFITGSDQVFRIEYFGNDFGKYFLDFADINKKKVALSASFGLDYINSFEEKINKAKELIQQFDYISTRELSGVNICKNYFDCEAEQIIDPVFLAENTIYDKLEQNSIKDFSNKVIAYVLDENNEYQKLYNKFSDKEIYKLQTGNDTIEDFIKAFKQAEYIITDSFHGLCFSIIFKKPFICIANKYRGYSRFETLGEIFNIENYIFNDINEALNNSNNLQDINYEEISTKIIEYRNHTAKKLKEIINSPKEITHETIYKAIKNLKDEIYILNQENTELKNNICELKNLILKIDKIRKTILLFKGVLR